MMRYIRKLRYTLIEERDNGSELDCYRSFEVMAVPCSFQRGERLA